MSNSLTYIHKPILLVLLINVALISCRSFEFNAKLTQVGDDCVQSYMFFNDTTLVTYSVGRTSGILYSNFFNRNSFSFLGSNNIFLAANGTYYKTSAIHEEGGVTSGYFFMGSELIKIDLWPELGDPQVLNLTAGYPILEPSFIIENNEYLFLQPLSILVNFSHNPTLTTSVSNTTYGFASGFVDDQIGYFGTKNGKILQINLTISDEDGAPRDGSDRILNSLSSSNYPIELSIYDSIRNYAYFFSSDENTNYQSVIKIDLTTFTLLNVTSPTNSLLQGVISAAIDTVGGQIYFGTDQGSAGRFSLPQFAFDTSVPTLDSNEVNVRSVHLDVENQYVYFFGDNSELYQVDIPELCPQNCSGRGGCYYETCNCTSGFGGDDCTNILCSSDCSTPNGRCDYALGRCICEYGFLGNDCSIRTCKGDCLGNGVCNTTSFQCICNQGYYGDDCSQVVPAVCSDYTSCGTCTANSSCGWCESSNLCTEGDSEGPLDSNYGCTRWYYDHCPAPAMTAFSVIFTIVAAILLLINMCSVLITDKNAPPGRADEFEVRRGYWRNQRSAKLWHMIDQIQFAAITAQFAVSVPSIYGEFVSIFRWSVIGFPLPWSQRSEDFPPSRDLLSIAQYATSTLAYPAEIFYGNLFWLGVLIGVVSVFFILVSLYAGARDHDNLKEFVKYRYIYTLLRIIFFAYLPLTVTGAYVIGYGTVTSAIIAAIYLGVVNLGVIAFIFKLIPRQRAKSHKLFQSEFLRKFGCIYQIYYFRRSWYTILVLIKKLIMGFIIGFGQNSPVGTLVALIILHLVYLVQLFFVKPYLDHVHMFLDIITSIFNILVVLLMFSFLDGVADRTTTIIITVFVTMFLLITMVICIVTYFNSWLKMKNIHSFRQLIDRCRGRDQNDFDKSPGLNTDIELTTKHD